MSLQTIQAAYAAFAKNDPSVLFGAMAPDIQWNEAEGNPLADRNPYVGPQAIGEGVFGRLLAAIDGFSAVPDHIVDGGHEVVACGRYRGTMKHSGASLDCPVLPRLDVQRRPHRVLPAVHGHGAVGAADAVMCGSPCRPCHQATGERSLESMLSLRPAGFALASALLFASANATAQPRPRVRRHVGACRCRGGPAAHDGRGAKRRWRISNGRYGQRMGQLALILAPRGPAGAGVSVFRRVRPDGSPCASSLHSMAAR
jgi:ketosteroid isomerase-like protein